MMIRLIAGVANMNNTWSNVIGMFVVIMLLIPDILSTCLIITMVCLNGSKQERGRGGRIKGEGLLPVTGVVRQAYPLFRCVCVLL